MMDPLWPETCWNTFKYFIISIVSTYYILCISWTVKCLILIFEDFWKICWETQFSLNCDNNNGYLVSGSMYIYHNISWVIFRIGSISHVIVNKIKTRILCSVFPSNPPPKIYTFHVIMRNSMVVSKPQMTVQCCVEKMRFPFLITKARIQSDTNKYFIFISCPL